MKKVLPVFFLINFLFIVSGCSLINPKKAPMEVVNEKKSETIKAKKQNQALLNIIEHGISANCENNKLTTDEIAYCKEMISANNIIAKKDQTFCQSLEDVDVQIYCNNTFLERGLVKGFDGKIDDNDFGAIVGVVATCENIFDCILLPKYNEKKKAKSDTECIKNCACAENICEGAVCEDGCGGTCQGEIISQKGTGSCQAAKTNECGDPYENDGTFRENWAGEWDNFDQILDLDWERIRDEEWCDLVNGDKVATADNTDCRIIECHKTLKCNGEGCTQGSNNLCIVENDKFVWKSEQQRDWCLLAEYGDPSKADPEFVCNDKCQNNIFIQALFDGLDPIITLADGEGRPIEKVLEEEANSSLSLAETSLKEDIYWYHKSVPVFPVCEDVEPPQKSIYVVCDRAGQNCDINAQYTSSEACFEVLEKNQLCKEIKSYKSGCGLSGGQRTVHNHKGTVVVNHQDRAGNKGKASNVPLYIDHNMPDIDTLKVKITTVDFPEGDVEMELFPNPDLENEKLVAHDKYKILIQLEDSSCLTEGCEKKGYISGISGIDWKHSEIILRDRSDSFNIKLNSVVAGALINFSFGTVENEKFSFKRTTESQFVPETANFLETAELTFSGDFFKKVGQKSIDFIFRDKAGNILNTSNEEKSIFLDIGPAIASKIDLDTAACEQVLANNIDTCKVKIALWDKYENPVTNRKVRLAGTINQNVNGSYNVFEDPQQAFVNGIRMEEVITKSKPGLNDFLTYLPIRAMVPSIYLKSNKIGDDEVLHIDENNENFWGSTTRNVDLVLEVEKVNGISQPIDKYSLFDKNTSVNLTFLPWVYLRLTAQADCSETSDLPTIILAEKPFNLNLCAYAGNGEGVVGKSLPEVFITKILGHTPAETDFINYNIDQDIIGDKAVAMRFAGENQRSLQTFLQPTTVNGSGDLTDIAITSAIEIDIPEFENPSQIKTITYPGGGLGLDQKLQAYSVGLDIEGGLLGEEYATPETMQILEMGGISAHSIDTELKANVSQIIANKEANNDVNKLKNNINFKEENVKYYNEDVIIGGTVSGKGTIVIKDANLIIEKDLTYANKESSLGIILINTEQSAEPETGNIYISPDVKKFVGTYFADGSILSRAPGRPIDYIKGRNYETQLNNQLILEGVAFTENTRGGSLGPIDSDQLFTSWGKTSDLAKAKKYDLNFIRRYTSFEVDLTDCGVGRNEKDVECNPFCTPSERNEEKCDRNTHAFIIRPDHRVLNLPPPGFIGIKTLK